MSLGEAAAAIGARASASAVRFSGCAIDSRTVARGALFVALRGARHDGHEFIDHARARGAAAAMVGHDRTVALPALRVPDTLAGLDALARAWRARFELPLVAVTGSAGKTTVKEMLGAILAGLGPALVTCGNRNNQIGVPLTLLRLGPEHRHAVIELGANHPGEIACLARSARPTVGLITQAGAAHLEGFGDVAGVARAKGELIEALPPDGVAVLNADDPHLGLWRRLAGARPVIEFGRAAHAAVVLRHEPRPGRARVVLETARGRVEAELAAAGPHAGLNAAAAVAGALAVGVDEPALLARGLATARAPARRWQERRGPGEVRVIDDCYNANPLSLAAALEMLAGYPAPRWLVLGEMAELGPEAPRLHREAGRLARERGVERLFASGALGAEAAAGFGPGAVHCERLEALLERLRAELPERAVVLVKGSRAARMERVVSALAGEE